MIVTIYKVTHAPDCPRLILPQDAMEVVRAADTVTRCKRWPANPVTASLAQRDKVSPKQFYFVNNSVLVYPESMMLNYEDIHWVTAYNTTAERIVAGDINFELLDVLEVHPPDPERGAPCLVDQHYSPLFRIASDPLGIYASAGHLGLRSEFVGAYQHLGLKGLVFDPVWSGEV